MAFCCTAGLLVVDQMMDEEMTADRAEGPPRPGPGGTRNSTAPSSRRPRPTLRLAGSERPAGLAGSGERWPAGWLRPPSWLAGRPVRGGRPGWLAGFPIAVLAGWLAHALAGWLPSALYRFYLSLSLILARVGEVDAVNAARGKRNYTDEQIRVILGENFIRV
jgi:hypothetical protein